MSIQLINLKNVLLCSGIILKRNDTSEEWQAKVSDIKEYGCMTIIKIYAKSDNVVIELSNKRQCTPGGL